MSEPEVPNPASGWTLASLEELCTKIADGTHRTPEYQSQGVRFISIMNVRPFRPIDWNSYVKFISREEHRELSKRCPVEFDDIVFPRIGTLGFAKRIDFHDEVSLFVGLGLLKPDKRAVLPKYLEYYMNTPWIAELSHQRASGSGRLTLALEQSRRLPVLLSPANEQLRIVDSLDSYFTRLDDSAASLERVQVKLKAYRASVLKAAVEGRLVPTETSLARAEKRDYEPAEVLLNRILQERRRRWEEAELGKLKAAGKTPKDENWKAKYEEPAGVSAEALSRLPEGWCWATVEQLGFIASGQTPSGITDRLKATGDVPWFRVGDMNLEGNKPFMRNARNWLIGGDVETLGLHVRPAGTIIFPKRGGAIATNKKRRLARPSAYDLNTMGVVPVGAIDDYLWLWFLNLDLGSLSDGSNVPQINNGDIAPLPVPLPPLCEQERITAEVDRKVSVAERVLAVVGANTARSKRLRQSILKSAFKGTLVEQDPSDEPAGQLLARIRADRAAVAPSKATSGRRARGAE